jgi:hypothetical protein
MGGKMGDLGVMGAAGWAVSAEIGVLIEEWVFFDRKFGVFEPENGVFEVFYGVLWCF